jgi:hypothetical protein
MGGKMGLTLTWKPEQQSSGFDDEAWPLLNELIPNGPTILEDPDQKALQDALEAMNKAAFGP